MFSEISEFDWHTRHRCAEIFGYEYHHVVHWPAKLVHRLLRSRGCHTENYTTISSVRNPWARMVSMYFDLKPEMTFTEFIVKGLPNLKSGKINYWDTYEMFHDEDGQCLVDHIVRIEFLEQELGPIIKEKFPELKVDFSVKKNTSKHRHYSHYYDDETRQLVADYAKYEIERWGYCFEYEDV